MKYSKPALTLEEQADLMLARGLLADRDLLIARLQCVNYYRLSGYLFPFRRDDDTYEHGTTLDVVWRRYSFDRRLRLLVLDAIERVEVAVRTQLLYEHVHRHGPFGYTSAANLPKLSPERFGKLLVQISEQFDRSHEAFARHFKRKYGDQHHYPPLWMAAEIMPFGATLTFFKGATDTMVKTVAAFYGQPDRILDSWLLSLNTVRNICAHHGRLWNRTFGLRPMIPRRHKHPEWHEPVSFRNDKIFAVLTILQYLLDHISPQDQWPQQLFDLLQEYADIPQDAMGFPHQWRSSPIWSPPPPSRRF